MKRERATELIEALLERVAEGAGEHLPMVDAVYVFGSYARGALNPGDVDVAVEYTPTEDWRKWVVTALTQGRDWNGPLKRELTAGRRGMQPLLNEGKLDVPFELTLLWRRGDNFAAARERLAAIQPDPTAGKSRRDAMVPAFEGVDQWIPLPLRKALIRRIDAGLIEIEQFVIPGAVIDDRRVARQRLRWKEDSAMRRAADSAFVYLRKLGVPAERISLAGLGRSAVRPTHRIDFRWRGYYALWYVFEDYGLQEWVEVLNPTKTQPLAALRITARDSAKLRELGPLL